MGLNMVAAESLVLFGPSSCNGAVGPWTVRFAISCHPRTLTVSGQVGHERASKVTHHTTGKESGGDRMIKQIKIIFNIIHVNSFSIPFYHVTFKVIQGSEFRVVKKKKIFI